MTNTRTVDVPEILAVLERLVEREGADTQRQRIYVKDGVPLCIAACAYVELGVSVNTVAQFENKTVQFIGTRFLDGITLTVKAVDVLDAAQYTQDRGYDWGNALAAAKALAERVVL